jgi:hypothetical protein
MPAAAKHSTAADTSQAVSAFMSSLEHPAKEAIEAVRAALLETHPSIQEGVKWNSPSFRTTEYFATVNLRTKQGVGVVLHFGAKARALAAGAASIDDPEKLLQWVAKDRATLNFTGLTDLQAKKSAFQAIVQQWIVHV